MRRAISEGVNVAAESYFWDLRNTASRRCASSLQHVLSSLPSLGNHHWSLRKVWICAPFHAIDLEQMCCRRCRHERSLLTSQPHCGAGGLPGLDATQTRIKSGVRY